MLEYLKGINKSLDRSIFEGERYDKSLRGITYGALLIVVMNTVTSILNLRNGYYSAVVAALAFIISGLIIVFFTHFRRNREAAVITALISVIIIFTYETFTVSHGFPIFWTLLLPLAFCYLANVKSGIYLSVYFLALFCVLFATPLHDMIPVRYSDVIVQRFPILYLADVVMTTYIMIQYHQTTLGQMDNAAQLLEAKEAADRANAAKSDFLANMSHEIRTPINAVLGMNEMIIRESERAKRLQEGDIQSVRLAFEDISSYAGDVQSAGGSLLSIVNAILDFSKIEAGKMEIVNAPYSLGSMLNDVINLTRFRAEEKGLRFVVDADELLPDELCGDKVHVRQIVTNVLANAVKYTDQGSVRLKVRGIMDGGNEPGQILQLIIEVRDTGIGIKSEDLGKMFAKFQRVDMDRNSTIEGTGLGLAISQDLLTMMGGDIRAESEYGSGSTFIITLPQEIVSSDPVGRFREHHESSDARSSAYTETFRAPDAHILIVDDTKMNLTVAVGLLRNTGLQISTATGGLQSIELAQAHRYDLILMDQRMPEVDGIEAMRRIRDMETGPNRETPIICLTADAVIGARERYLSEGFTDYLAKPIDSLALEKMLMKYLPSEKVIRLTGVPGKADVGEGVPDGGVPDGGVPDASMPDDLASLCAAGIDATIGLGYCEGDETLYRSILKEYVASAEEKTRNLEGYREAKDWENLAILAHSVKSSSRMIGATALADVAASMEQAADEGDAKSVEEEFPQFVAQYGGVVEILRPIVPPADEMIFDDEIMEFLPE